MKAEFIESIETWNSGGNVMLDVVKLKSGKLLIISDEAVCKYNSNEEWMGDEGERDYDKHCIDLIKSFMFNGIEIINPFVSECGRFEVDPDEYYGEAYRNSLK